ncbi:capsid assembly scaffolding protein Gp46 family protein [Fusobacterium hominis]|uniref:capsid assembly scaffolding protein Gp46 family protein n=1 Tax=Fusobacterium hominis TaxID=2764326 RepID=UPI0022E6F1E7|nr:DUF4355 domain-containing protein [Fusobacterium hominis]
MADDIKTFTQEEVNKMIEDRLAREKKKFEAEKKELERQHGESIEDYEERIRNANLTAEEKYQKELAKLKKDIEQRDAELTTIKSNEIKGNMLDKYKLSRKFLNRITGNTEEEIENSVKEFSEAIGEYMKNLGGGTPPNLTGTEEAKAKLETLKQKAYETGSAVDRAAYVRAKNELETGGN